MRPLALALLAGATFAGPVLAKDGLHDLIPLVELYAADAQVTLGFDVAGIRCAGLYAAQADWAATHGLRGPTAKQRKDIELHLTRAEIYRRDQGQSLTKAYESTRTDVLRVMGLYTDHFAERAKDGGHPWQGDALIRSDSGYCEILGRD